MKAKKHLKGFDPINLKILSELSAFFMSRGARQLQMELKDEEDMVCIHISGSIEEIWKEDVDELTNQLNVQRQHEVESYYWQLSGEDEFEDFVAVGMMVDKAEIVYKDGRLEINVTRLK
jgi:hypothetical protein